MSGKHPPTGMSNPGPRAGDPGDRSGYWHVGTGGAIAEFVCRAHLFPSGPLSHRPPRTMPTTLDVKSKRAIGNSHRAIPRLRLDGTLERASMEGRFLAGTPRPADNPAAFWLDFRIPSVRQSARDQAYERDTLGDSPVREREPFLHSWRGI